MTAHIPTSRPRRRALRLGAVLLLLAAGAGACAPIHFRPRLTPDQHWWIVTDSVVAAVDSGRYDLASRMLVTFAARHPSTSFAADALYWRALLRLDPRNGGGSTRAAYALLDSAASLPAFAERHVQIAIARRLSRQVEELTRRNEQLSKEIAEAREAVAGAAPAARPTDRAPEPRALAEEVQRLREELARANAELERVRKRLAAPTRP